MQLPVRSETRQQVGGHGKDLLTSVVSQNMLPEFAFVPGPELPVVLPGLSEGFSFEAGHLFRARRMTHGGRLGYKIFCISDFLCADSPEGAACFPIPGVGGGAGGGASISHFALQSIPGRTLT